MYIDASALAKLVLDEPESSALRASWAAAAGRPVSCEIVVAELMRAVRRASGGHPLAERQASEVLAPVTLVPLTRSLIDSSASLAPLELRTLDAVHLACALSLGDLDAVMTYDRRLAEAAAAAGLATVSPA